MRRARLGIVLLAVLLASGLALAKDLFWRAFDVKARLDASGALHVVEAQTMVFDGDWNGGERTFRVLPGQGLAFESDHAGRSGRHAAPALSRGSLGSRPVQVRRQQRPALEEPPAVRSALRPSRARLRDRLHARGNSRQTGRPVRARPRLRLPRPAIPDPAVRADAHARPGVEAVVAAFGALRDGRAAAGAGLRRAGRARARGSGHALLQSGAARPDAGIAGAAPGTARRVRDRDRAPRLRSPSPRGCGGPLRAADAAGFDRRRLAREEPPLAVGRGGGRAVGREDRTARGRRGLSAPRGRRRRSLRSPTAGS